MLTLVRRKRVKTSGVSFLGGYSEAKRRKRVLIDPEAQKLFPLLPMAAAAREFGLATAISEGDLLRLTDNMINEDAGTIELDGGRIKNECQASSAANSPRKEILCEIRADGRHSKVKSMAGLIFTRADGSHYKDMITGKIRRASNAAGLRHRLHDLRHTAKTNWARQGSR